MTWVPRLLPPVWETRMKFWILSSTWHTHGCCDRLGHEPADRIFVWLFLSSHSKNNFFFKINDFLRVLEKGGETQESIIDSTHIQSKLPLVEVRWQPWGTETSPLRDNKEGKVDNLWEADHGPQDVHAWEPMNPLRFLKKITNVIHIGFWDGVSTLVHHPRGP